MRRFSTQDYNYFGLFEFKGYADKVESHTPVHHAHVHSLTELWGVGVEGIPTTQISKIRSEMRLANPVRKTRFLNATVLQIR